MCQLNVFLVSNTIPIKSILSNMDNFGMEGHCITEDFKSNELSSKYNFYISPSYSCHCHSFVTKYSGKEYDGKNIIEILTEQKNKEIEVLYDMRKYISRENYLEEKCNFLKTYNELHPKVIKKENEFFKKHRNSANFSSDLQSEINNSSLHIEWREFFEKNKQMYDSIFYYSKEYNHNLDLEDMISNAEEENFKYEQEYIQLRDWITSIVHKYGNVLFFSYWQDNSQPIIESFQKININQVSFELFARLQYLRLLDITR